MTPSNLKNIFVKLKLGAFLSSPELIIDDEDSSTFLIRSPKCIVLISESYLRFGDEKGMGDRTEIELLSFLCLVDSLSLDQLVYLNESLTEMVVSGHLSCIQLNEIDFICYSASFPIVQPINLPCLSLQLLLTYTEIRELTEAFLIDEYGSDYNLEIKEVAKIDWTQYSGIARVAGSFFGGLLEL